MTDHKRQGEIQMGITSDGVREIFKGLENGDGAAFFEHVADDVDWIVMGTHPLAAHYHSKKAFIAGTFDKLAQVLPEGAQLEVEYLIVKDDQAVVELHSLATAKNGMRFDNRYCWVVYFQDALIVRVRAYLDSALVARIFEENPIAGLRPFLKHKRGDHEHDHNQGRHADLLQGLGHRAAGGLQPRLAALRGRL